MKTLIYIISGNQGEGKTTFIKELAVELRNNGYQCSGFYAEGYWNQQVRSRFDIVEINGAYREILCNLSSEKGDLQYRHFFFKHQALKLGSNILENACGSRTITFIDEVGGLESENKGWADAIAKLLLNPPLAMIWTARKTFINDICGKFNITPRSIWDISLTNPGQVLLELREELSIT